MTKSKICYLCIVLFLALSCSKSSSHGEENSGSDSEDPTHNDGGKDKQTEKITLADPTIYYDKDTDTYYLYGTSGDNDIVNSGFEVYSSPDLEKWKKENELALEKSNVYGIEGFWAPQVFKHDGDYYMAYTADEHIAIAKSDNPEGPFGQSDKKPISDPKNMKTIDPYVFIDNNDEKYLYYVRLTPKGNRLYTAKLKDDLSDIDTSTVTSSLNAEDQPQTWENLSGLSSPITEGPAIIKRDSLYYFFYSANHFEDPNYATGYATSDDPFGPWDKYEDNPILNKETIGENGPGHGDFFRDKEGDYYYVFHTHNSKQEIQPRVTGIIKGEFKSEDNGEEFFEFDKDSFRYLTTDTN